MDLYVVSDHHFSHENILKFTREDGSFLRPGFKDISDMDEFMIRQHNKIITPTTKVYFLGDVGMKRDRLDMILPRLNGKKRLILGNHDKFHMSFYVKHFEKIYESWQPLRNVLLTHRPVLLGDHDHHKKLMINVHGHTHHHIIKDQRYINVCVENTEYAPIHWSEIEKEIARRGFKLD